MKKATKAKKGAAKSKSLTKKKAASKPILKASKKAGAKKASVSSKQKEKRAHKRLQPKNLWITEFCGDFQFSNKVRDISEGGIFLEGKLQANLENPSTLRIRSLETQLELQALPVRDEIAKEGIGTGYAFINITKAQTEGLRGLLRNLN